MTGTTLSIGTPSGPLICLRRGTYDDIGSISNATEWTFIFNFCFLNIFPHEDAFLTLHYMTIVQSYHLVDIEVDR